MAMNREEKSWLMRNRRKLIYRMDAMEITDYLVAEGALTQGEALEILQQNSFSARTASRLLLDLIRSRDRWEVFRCFQEALFETGHGDLALSNPNELRKQRSAEEQPDYSPAVQTTDGEHAPDLGEDRAEGAELRHEASRGIDVQTTDPLVLLCKSQEAGAIFFKALSKGSVRIRRLRLFVCGQYGVGKTSVVKTILNQPFDPKEASTEGIQFNPSHCKLDIETCHDWIAGDAPLQDQKSIAMECFAEIERLSRDTDGALENLSTVPGSQDELRQLLVQEETDAYIQRIEAAAKAGRQIDTDELARIIQQLKDDPNVMSERESDELQISICDFAGQAVYYSIQHLFMTSIRIIYLLVFKVNETYLSRGLNSGFLQAAPNIFRTKFNERKLCAVNSGMTDFDYLLQWLSAIHYAGKAIGERGLVKSKVQSPVVLVATHADEVPLLTPEDLFENLSRLCNDVEAFQHIDMFQKTGVHLINNKLSGTEATPCKDVQHLRNHISHLAKQLLSLEEEIPKTWLKFEKSLKVLCGDSERIPWLKLDQVRTLIEDVCDVEDEVEQLILLSFYHNLGLIVHFQEPEELSSIVVLDVQWLISLLAKVITVKCITTAPPAEQKHWKRLEEAGELSKELINMVWKDELSSDLQTQLIGIMKAFDLLCDGYYDNGTDKQPFYFVPSVIVHEANADEFMRSPLNNEYVIVASMHEVPLIIQSADQGMAIPHSLYFRLVVRLLREWRRVDLKYNCIRLRFKDEEEDCDEFEIVLCHNAHTGTIKLAVQWQVFKHDSGPLEDEHYFKTKPHRMANVCTKVRERVFDCLYKVCHPAMLQLAFVASIASPCRNCRRCSRHRAFDCRDSACAGSMPTCKRHSVRLCSSEPCAEDVCAPLCEVKMLSPRTGPPCSKCRRPCPSPKNARCWVVRNEPFEFPDGFFRYSREETAPAVAADVSCLEGHPGLPTPPKAARKGGQSVHRSHGDAALAETGGVPTEGALTSPQQSLTGTEVAPGADLSSSDQDPQGVLSPAQLELRPVTTSQVPDLKFLLTLSKRVNKIFDCRQLAIRLDLDDDIVTREEQHTKDPNAIALAVLKKWRITDLANWQHLYDALNCDTFCHLARECGNKLHEMDESRRN